MVAFRFQNNLYILILSDPLMNYVLPLIMNTSNTSIYNQWYYLQLATTHHTFLIINFIIKVSVTASI